MAGKENGSGSFTELQENKLMEGSPSLHSQLYVELETDYNGIIRRSW